MYKEELMDHFKYPRNRNKLENPDFSNDQNNVSCGDSISVEGKVVRDVKSGKICISELGFDGSGCVISQATASMLTEKCIGKTLDEALALNKDDILEMIDLQLGPTRLRCALLCLQALQKGILSYKDSMNKSD